MLQGSDALSDRSFFHVIGRKQMLRKSSGSEGIGSWSGKLLVCKLSLADTCCYIVSRARKVKDLEKKATGQEVGRRACS